LMDVYIYTHTRARKRRARAHLRRLDAGDAGSAGVGGGGGGGAREARVTEPESGEEDGEAMLTSTFSRSWDIEAGIGAADRS
jgi:hypothetical protein